MLWTIELTPGQKYEVEQAIREKVTKLRQNAAAMSDPRLAALIDMRADRLTQSLRELRDAEVA